MIIMLRYSYNIMPSFQQFGIMTTRLPYTYFSCISCPIIYSLFTQNTVKLCHSHHIYTSLLSLYNAIVNCKILMYFR